MKAKRHQKETGIVAVCAFLPWTGYTSTIWNMNVNWHHQILKYSSPPCVRSCTSLGLSGLGLVSPKCCLPSWVRLPACLQSCLSACLPSCLPVPLGCWLRLLNQTPLTFQPSGLWPLRLPALSGLWLLHIFLLHLGLLVIYARCLAAVGAGRLYACHLAAVGFGDHLLHVILLLVGMVAIYSMSCCCSWGGGHLLHVILMVLALMVIHACHLAAVGVVVINILHIILLLLGLAVMYVRQPTKKITFMTVPTPRTRNDEISSHVQQPPSAQPSSAANLLRHAQPTSSAAFHESIARHLAALGLVLIHSISSRCSWGWMPSSAHHLAAVGAGGHLLHIILQPLGMVIMCSSCCSWFGDDPLRIILVSRELLHII